MQKTMLDKGDLEVISATIQRALGKLMAVEELIAEGQQALQTGSLPSSISANLYYARWDLAESCGNLQAAADWLAKAGEKQGRGEE